MSKPLLIWEAMGQIEKNIDSLLKQRAILFDHVSHEPPNTSGWRYLMVKINDNTDKVGELRRKWWNYHTGKGGFKHVK